VAASGRRVERTRGGWYRLRLNPEERAILADLPAQLTEILESRDPALRRLFPPAYADDPRRSAEFDRLMREDLLARHRSNLDTLRRTASIERLTQEEMTSWLGALNALRLTLGTRLDVDEDHHELDLPESDPRFVPMIVYGYLGGLQEEIVEAMSEGLDPAGLPDAPRPPA
jgi:uncharacterized protein DUF2017